MSAEDNSHLLKGVAVSRLMNPVDANVFGNVHGGVILNLIEEAGCIIASRYCNRAGGAASKAGEDEPFFAAMARIEHMDFLLPMHIGEVAELEAEIYFTAPHSLLVLVTVWAENVLSGKKRLTNKAHLWYVPVGVTDHSKIGDVPPMKYSSPLAEEKGRRLYEKQKAERQTNGQSKELVDFQIPSKPFASMEPHTVESSRSYLSMVVGVNECTLSGVCRGGVVLKMMDECAGIVAAKHSRGPCVTACIEAINFHKRCSKGSLLTVFGQATFTSARSVEVEVIVECECFRRGNPMDTFRERAADAFFTYVCMGKDGKTQPVPPLKIEGDQEKARFAAGEQRYHMRKLKRQASMEEQMQLLKAKAQ